MWEVVKRLGILQDSVYTWKYGVEKCTLNSQWRKMHIMYLPLPQEHTPSHVVKMWSCMWKLAYHIPSSNVSVWVPYCYMQYDSLQFPIWGMYMWVCEDVGKQVTVITSHYLQTDSMLLYTALQLINDCLPLYLPLPSNWQHVSSLYTALQLILKGLHDYLLLPSNWQHVSSLYTALQLIKSLLVTVCIWNQTVFSIGQNDSAAVDKSTHMHGICTYMYPC